MADMYRQVKQQRRETHSKQQRVHYALSGPILTLEQAKRILANGYKDEKLLAALRAKV